MMSTYWTLACHTCKQRLELPSYTREFVSQKAGDWATYSHLSHKISILSDAGLGFDEKYDKYYDTVKEYNEVFDDKLE